MRSQNRHKNNSRLKSDDDIGFVLRVNVTRVRHVSERELALLRPNVQRSTQLIPNFVLRQVVRVIGYPANG